MPQQLNYPQRRSSPRLLGYDYSLEGAYFITICTQNRACLFGEVKQSEMCLNEAGEMVVQWWNKLPDKFPNIGFDAWVVMPNHLHGIVIVRDQQHATLSRMVQWFKVMTTNAYIRGVKQQNWERFPGKLWQRSFHDHIIRNEDAYRKIHGYVFENPALWEADRFHPMKSNLG